MINTKDSVIALMAAAGIGTGGTSLYTESEEDRLMQDFAARVAVVENEVLHAKENTKEIKDGVKDNSKKLDELKDLIRERQ